MKGIMFIERGQAAIIEEPEPVCQDDTMLVKTLYSGLSNGTERMFLVGGNYGDETPWPKRLAYQHVSKVVACGEKVHRFKPGDIVYSSTFPGHVEYLLLRETDLVVKLPAGFDLIEAAQLGVASVAYHDVQRAQVSDSDTVLVFGGGLIGQLAAQAARVMGAHVTLVDRLDDRLVLASELGAHRVINTATEAGQAELRSHSPYSVVLECSGADVLDTIIGMPGKPGLVGQRAHARLVLVAGRYDVRYNFNMAGMAELNILHTQHFDQSDLEQVVEKVVQGQIRIRPLIRDVVPFDDAVRIFNTLRDSPNQLLGTVFVMPDTVL